MLLRLFSKKEYEKKWNEMEQNAKETRASKLSRNVAVTSP